LFLTDLRHGRLSEVDEEQGDASAGWAGRRARPTKRKERWWACGAPKLDVDRGALLLPAGYSLWSEEDDVILSFEANEKVTLTAHCSMIQARACWKCKDDKRNHRWLMNGDFPFLLFSIFTVLF
jgi:hypothetical protein